MTYRTGVMGFILFCLVCSFCFFPTESISVSKDPTPKSAATAPAVKPPASAKPATPPTTPPAQPELNAAIEKIFIKDNKVFVVLNRTGSGKIVPEDYAKIVLHLETSKGRRQWNLAEIDKTRSLGSGTGRVEFDTGIVLDKSETVKGILSFGKIEKPKQEALVLAPAIAGTKTGPVSLGPATMRAEMEKPSNNLTAMNSVMASSINRRSTVPSPRTMELDDAGGIRIITPGAGQIQKPGDTFPVSAFFLRTLSDPTAYGYVEFALRRLGVSDVFATARQPYRQSSDDRNCVANFTLPARGLPLGPDYYITATHPEVWGIGNTFTIQTPGEGQIRVLKPEANEVDPPGTVMNINYQFTRHVGSGQMSFELYRLDTDGRYGTPVASFTRNYSSGPAGPAEPIHMINYTLPRDLGFGQYFIQITHPEASGRSSAFSVNPAEIRVLRPRARENLTPGFPMNVDYQFTRRTGEGQVAFSLYKDGEGPRNTAAGRVTRVEEPVLQFTRNHTPGPAGTPEPIHALSYALPRDMAPGRYYLQVSHREARGFSDNFNVTWEMGGDEAALCDYGITSASFRDGRPLDSALIVGSGSLVQGTFRVGIRWNGIHVPSGHYPVEALPYSIGVYSSMTGARIGTTSFAYRTNSNFDIDVYFEFAKDNIPGMKREGVIPLEFRLEKARSDTIDGSPANNLLTANMAVSNAVENNMEISSLNSSDFSLTRTPHVRPRKDEYHLTQKFKVRNFSGGSATVKIKGCLYKKDPGESWSEASSVRCTTLADQRIGAAWTEKTLNLNFNEEKPWEIPSDTRLRIIVEVDPDKVLIDSNRSNNTAIRTFRITEGAPGAGSGTVVDD